MPVALIGVRRPSPMGRRERPERTQLRWTAPLTAPRRIELQGGALAAGLGVPTRFQVVSSRIESGRTVKVRGRVPEVALGVRAPFAHT